MQIGLFAFGKPSTLASLLIIIALAKCLGFLLNPMLREIYTHISSFKPRLLNKSTGLNSLI